jgi:flagellar biosynthesis protein FlhF
MNLVNEKDVSMQTGKKFRLVVKSAEEAVRVIREKLGERAKVLSVRQVGGEGLKRFISSPKLEVIAEIPPENVEATPLEENEQRVDEIRQLEPVDTQDSSTLAETNVNLNVTLDQFSNDQPKDFNNQEVSKILIKAGFDTILLDEIKSWTNWNNIKDLPLSDVLKQVTVELSDRFRALNAIPTSNKIALIGPPGVGKTTTLCKFIAHEVFMNKKVPSILKVENGIPNPDDALRVFCDVVGVTLHRESTSLPEPSDANPLYLDFPGLSLLDLDDWGQAKETLDSLDIDTRVLILNSAYDRDVAFKAMRAARQLGATHLALTHFDEISNSTKLWPIILKTDLSLLCVCNGQNVTGDFSTNVLNQLISKTFPEELYSKGFSTYRRVN